MDLASTEKEDGKYMLGIYLDIKKAFDAVNHEILINKLYKYGIRGVPLSLIKNYLTGRSQRVKLYDRKGSKILSDELRVDCGVPQGSVLGPLLFLLYINDLKNASILFKTITYADDTNMFMSHRNLTDLYASANSELRKIENWFSSNRLCLNVAKTSYQLYTSKKVDIVPTLYISNTQIKREKVVKFLGVLVDESLTFKEYINHICKKVAVGIGFMFRSRDTLEEDQLNTLYNALVLPHLNYCSLIWSINFKTHLQRIFLLQKRAARVILGMQYLESVSRRFIEIGMKPISMLRDLKCMITVYKIKHGMLPTTVRSLLEWRIPNDRQPLLRHTGQLIVPFCKTVYKQHTFKAYAPKLFNNLSNLSEIHLDVPISTYKRKVLEQLETLNTMELNN